MHYTQYSMRVLGVLADDLASDDLNSTEPIFSTNAHLAMKKLHVLPYLLKFVWCMLFLKVFSSHIYIYLEFIYLSQISERQIILRIPTAISQRPVATMQKPTTTLQKHIATTYKPTTCRNMYFNRLRNEEIQCKQQMITQVRVHVHMCVYTYNH